MAQPILRQPNEPKSNTRLIVLLALLGVVVIGGGVLIYRYVLSPTAPGKQVSAVKGLDMAPLSDSRLVIISKSFGDAPTVSDAERGRENPFAPIQK